MHPNLLETVFHLHLSPTLNKEMIVLKKVNHIQVVTASANILPKWLDSVFNPSVISVVTSDEALAC